MAAENPAFVITADSHSAELFRLALAAAGLPFGVRLRQSAQGGIVSPGDLAVTGGTGNTINVAAGECFVPGTQGAHQSLYYCFNDAVANLAITPNGSNPLYALVTASVNDQAYSGNPGVTNNQWGLLVTQGTPAPSPSVPATPANSLVLATILVPTNASSSSSYTITSGVLNGPGVATIGAPAGRIHQTGAGTALTGTDTKVTNMSSDFLRGGVTFASDSLTVPVAGIYQVNWGIDLGASGGGSNLSGYASLYKNGLVTGYRTGSGTSTGEFVAWRGSDLIQLAAGDVLALYGTVPSISLTTQNTTSTGLSVVLVSF